MNYSVIEDILFKGKQNIIWKEVERYIKDNFGGNAYTVDEYGEAIVINYVSADEFAESKYTKRLRGALAKAKANCVQVLPDMIANATNRRWIENKDEKHKEDAKGGWYRYDVGFAIPVMADNETEKRWNYYRGTLLVRINNRGLFFYDIIDIKKEARMPQGSDTEVVHG